MKYKEITNKTITCDLCAGYGQFTIRLLRMLNNIKHIDPINFLYNNHTLTELQLPSCAKLIYIFGPNINLYVGDSLNMKFSDENDKGILFFNETNKQWIHNDLLDQLLTLKIVQNNLKLLLFIFDNLNNSNILNTLKNKLCNI